MALLPGIAAAADGAQPLPVVTVQGNVAAYDARRDDTAARIVVGREELARFGDTGVLDALKRQPGITVDANGAIAMRGLGKGYTQLLLNGDKVPSGFALDAISPDLIERIEIIRTPTAEQRAEAIAGTINIVLRKAGRRSARTARLQATQARGRPGAHLTVQAGEPGERLSWQLAGTAAHAEQAITLRSRTEGVDAAGLADLQRNGGFDLDWQARFLTLAPSATIRFAAGDTLAIESFLARTVVDKDGRGFADTVLGAPAPVRSDTQLTGERNTQLRAGLEWTHKVAASGTLNLKLNLSQFRRAADFRQQGFDGGGARNLVDDTASGIRERNLKNSGRYAHRLDEAHALVLGWEAERTTRWEDRRQTLRWAGMPPQALHFDFDAAIDRLALYAQDEWTVSEALALYLGLRGERVDLRTVGRDVAPVERGDGMVSPSAQLLWKLPGAPGRQVRMALSRTYKAPAPTALVPRPYTSTNNAPLEPDERGNPYLRPELARGLDAAFERHWNSGAMFSLGGYVRRIDGVTYEALALENGRWVKYPANGGKGMLRGMEFDTRFKLPGTDVRFNLTRNWSSRDDLPGPDNRIADQLRLSGTLGVDVQAASRWSTGASYSYKRGGRVALTPERDAIAGSRRELDAYALYAIAPGWKLRMAVSNALADGQVSGTRYRDGAGMRQVLETRTMPATLRAALEWSR